MCEIGTQKGDTPNLSVIAPLRVHNVGEVKIGCFYNPGII